MIRVGRDVFSTNKGRVVKVQYKDCVYDKNMWADASKFLPNEYDLVSLKLKSGKIISGWFSLNQWEGLRLQPSDEVLFWKKNELRQV